MTSLDAILAGSNSGPVIVPGKPEESLLVALASHTESPRMPPNAPRISQRELQSISAWISNLEVRDKADKAAAEQSSLHATRSNRSEAKIDGLVSPTPLPGPLTIATLASFGSLVAMPGLNQVVLIDAQNSNWIGALSFPEGDVLALRFSRDGRTLWAAGGVNGESGAAVCWEVASWQRRHSLKIEDDVALAMDVSPDGRRLAVGGPKKLIELIDLENLSKRQILKKHADWVTSLAFSNDGVFLASGDRFGSIYLWDVQGGVQFDAAGQHAGTVTALQFSRDSNQLWSSGKDGQINLWDLPTAKRVHGWTASEKGVASMLVDGERVIAIDQDQHLAIYQPTGREQSRTKLDFVPASLSVVHAPDSRILVGDFEASMHLLDLSSLKHQRSVSLPRESKPLIARRFPPKPIDRKLETEETGAASLVETPDAWNQAKVALEATQQSLQKTREDLAALERQMQELQQLIERLGPQSR